jgi:hypothetical protein
MLWILYNIIKVLKLRRSPPEIEYTPTTLRFFEPKKSNTECESWILSEKEYYYYDGMNFKKIEAIIYEYNINSIDEPVATPPGIVFHPSNVFTKLCDGNISQVSKKLKMIM